MIKIAICDDDLSVSSSVEDMIGRAGLADYTVDTFGSGTVLLNYLEQNHERYNIYLLDIEMPIMSGIELAGAIRRRDSNAVLIFVTSHREYVYDVFETLPFRFICKPVKQEEIGKAVLDAAAFVRRDSSIFFFQIGHHKYQVPYREIKYFEGAGRKVKLHAMMECWEFYGRISRLEENLDETLFVRVHASYIVNMEQIRSVRPDHVQLADHETLPVSRAYSSSTRQAHMDFIRRRGGL